MITVDTQVHIWQPERPDRQWIPGGQAFAHRPEPITDNILIEQMDSAGVDRVFVVAPSWEGPRNDYVIAAARRRPGRIGAIVRFALDDHGAQEQFCDWAKDPNIFGVRLLFHRGDAQSLLDGTAEWIWKPLERSGLPVMMFAPGQYQAVSALAKRHSELKIVLCHLGFNPATRDAVALSALSDLIPLAELPNVAVKATSLPSFVTEPYPFLSLRPVMHQVLDAFGSERVFWGSDLSRLSCNYEELWSFLRYELDVRDEDRANVLGAAACRWFQWPAARKDLT
jgi:L-fuconolactonase